MPQTIVGTGTSVKGFQDSNYITAPTGSVILSLVMPTVAQNGNSRYRGGAAVMVRDFPFSPSQAQFGWYPFWTRSTLIDTTIAGRLNNRLIYFYWRELNIAWVLYSFT